MQTKYNTKIKNEITSKVNYKEYRVQREMKGIKRTTYTARRPIQPKYISYGGTCKNNNTQIANI